MQVLFESRDPDGAQMREVATRRLRFVMRRLTWLVPRAKVQLADINGPKGGVDKRCQVELKTDVMGTVVVTSLAADWRTAIETAMSKAAKVLVRTLHKGKGHHSQAKRAVMPLVSVSD